MNRHRFVMALFKIYEEGHAALFPVHFFLTPWSHHLADKAGEPLKSLACVMRDGSMAWYAEPEEQTRLSKELLRRMLYEGLFEVVERQTRFHLEKMTAFCSRLEGTDFAVLDDAALCDVFSEYCHVIVQLNSWGMLVTLMEMGRSSVITEEAYRYLSGVAKPLGRLAEVSETVALLCTPTEATYLRDKRVGEIQAAILAKEIAIRHPDVQEKIAALHRALCWVSYGYVGPALERGHFEEEVATLAKRGDLDDLLQETVAESDEIKRRQQDAEEAFGLDDYGLRLFQLARTFMFQKEMRKQVLYRSFHAVEPLRRQLAKRSSVSLSDTAYILPDEAIALLRGALPSSVLQSRRRLCVALPFEERILVGAEAEAFAASLCSVKPLSADLSELSGQCGFAAAPMEGTVRLVFTAHDLDKLNEGDVLVSPATSPVMVPAMKKAGAIVTDQGGLTCHAAIVSRELKKPCVIGTKVATAWLKDGDRVVVDSTAGVVRRL